MTEKRKCSRNSPERPLVPVFRAGAGGRAGGTPRAPLCRRGAAVSPARARGAARDEMGNLGEKNGCERDGLDVSTWPVAWIITVTAIQNTFLRRKGGQSCVTLSASESRQGCCDQCCKLADT